VKELGDSILDEVYSLQIIGKGRVP